MRRLTLFSAAVLAAIATPAFAIDVSKSVEVEATPEATWAAVGDFCGIGEWHPAVEDCALSEENGTATRTLTLADDGGTIVEELVSRDDEAMRYTYRILSAGPLPVADYESTISVEPNGETTTLNWEGSFEAEGASEEEATSAIGGIYDAGLQGIAERAASM